MVRRNDIFSSSSEGVRITRFSALASPLRQAFTFPDLLVVLAALMLLLAIAVPLLVKSSSRTRQARCVSSLKEINRAVLLYAEDDKGTLALVDRNPSWWWYKELVKGNLGLLGASSPRDKVFACPSDRGYDEPRPFHSSPKFDFNSYVFNGVNLPGIPNLAGKNVGSINDPTKTLLMMEWTAHAPLSWHKSRTGKKNQPFYNDAESVVGFVDGHVDFIKIYYDGINAAYTRDPIPGYGYKYSGD
jgi:type II secretory pathway pseudopilin PulG